MRIELATTNESQPDLLALPLDEPLAAWRHPSLAEISTGIHRHVVRFVQHERRLYALKELPRDLADREWDHLRFLQRLDLPVVTPLGVIADRGPDLEDILITRHLEFSLPFRFLFTHTGLTRLSDALIDALAVLLVRLHLVGFWWGDCSLSNTLFRRDAGALAAWLVDTETGERHERLSDGQRQHELEVAQLNILGGLLDLEASGRLPESVDPVHTTESLLLRYEQLWNELTAPSKVATEDRHLIDLRLRRLNELGFDTNEIELVANPDGSGSYVRFTPTIVEAGHHRRRLRQLTGIDAQEGQSRRLLNDIYSYGAWLATQEHREYPEALIGYRWLVEVFEPTIAAVPARLHNRREPAELFHEVLLHRDALEAARHIGVKMPDAAASYAATALPFAETEQAVFDAGIGNGT